MLILLVAKDPLCSNHHLILRPLNQFSNLIASEVVQFFLHNYHSIWVLKSFTDISEFQTRDKRVMLTKRYKLTANSNTHGRTPKSIG
uniref:Uncharacterized protein n=1 Tax=Arundo donax TaxID=35708 RepID=A0A0A9FH60_ARUDO